MTDLAASSASALVAALSSGDLSASSVFGLVVYNYPADELQSGAASANIAYGRSGADDELKVSQAFAMVVVRGTPDWPVCRAWTFTLDGHDFYVLNTINETFVCDLSNDPPSWYIWGTGEDIKWRGWVGKQWIASLPYEEAFGSNVVVGDKALGTLYFLNPEQATDDSGDFELSAPVPFKRIVTGQVMVRGRSYVDCPGVELTGSVGALRNTDLYSVELFSSDDAGHTYTSHGSLTVTEGEYDTRLDWLSLGSMTSPGRLFRVVDYGALTRVDDLEMPDAEPK